MGRDEYSRKLVEDSIYAAGGDPTSAIESLPYVRDGEARIEGGQLVSTNRIRGRRGRGAPVDEEVPDCVDMLRELSGE